METQPNAATSETKTKKYADRFEKMGLGQYVINDAVIEHTEHFEEQYRFLLDSWSSFLKEHDDSLREDKDYFIHTRNLCEVIYRVDKRIAYYFVCLENLDICEYKWVGLYAYWLNTLKPFTVVEESSV